MVRFNVRNVLTIGDFSTERIRYGRKTSDIKGITSVRKTL